MKKAVLLSVAFAFLLLGSATAQNNFTQSGKVSPVTHIYKLDRGDLRQIYVDLNEIDERMLHTHVGTFNAGDPVPTLARGNYLAVCSKGNKIHYRNIIVDDIEDYYLLHDMLKLYIIDTLSNPVTDAIVKSGNRRLRFDPNTQTYNARGLKDGDMIEIDHNGVFHYLGYYEDETSDAHYNNVWFRIKNSFNRIFDPEAVELSPKQKDKIKDQGFIAFSKPKYRPGDTVRFKAYITDFKGNGYAKAVAVNLSGNGRNDTDTTLTTLKPYRPGMYEWEFPITDSLGLILDSYYKVSLLKKEKQERHNSVGDSFYFEDYELDKVSLIVEEAEKNKYSYQHGEQIKLKVKALADTGQPLRDGRLSITVTTSSPELIGAKSAFIPDTLWHHEMRLPVAPEHEIAIPDSIYPPNVELYAKARCVLLTSDNEKIVKNIWWMHVNPSGPAIYSSIEDSILHITALSGQDTVRTQVLLTKLTRDYDKIIDTISLPAALKIGHNVQSYDIETKSGYKHSVNIRTGIGRKCEENNGTLRLKLYNPEAFPLWYTIYRGKANIKTGYSTEKHIELALKQKKRGFAILMNYFDNYGWRPYPIYETYPYKKDSDIKIKIDTPQEVYPGQRLKVDVAVEDTKGNPVRNADVTAYAFKSSFGEKLPDVPNITKSSPVRPYSRERKYVDLENDNSEYKKLEYDRWKQRLGLDSVEYYRFLYPAPVYTYSEPAEQTHIMPYAIEDGIVLPVYIVYINDIPHYFKNRNVKNDTYAIATRQTGKANIRLRTFDREIEINDVYIEPGHKNVISVNAAIAKDTSPGTSNPAEQMSYRTVMLPDSLHGKLSETERETLGRGMILLQDLADTKTKGATLIWAPFTVAVDNTVYELNPAAIRRYDWKTKKQEKWDYLVGPFPALYDTQSGQEAMLEIYSDTVEKISFPILPMRYYYLDKNNLVRNNKWRRMHVWKTLNKETRTQQVNLSQKPYTIDAIVKNYRNDIIRIATENSSDIIITGTTTLGPNELQLAIEYSEQIKPAFTYLTIDKDGRQVYEMLSQGRRYNIKYLPAGEARVHILMSDSTLYSASVRLGERRGKTLLRIALSQPNDSEQDKAKIFEMLESLMIHPEPILPKTAGNAANAYKTVTGEKIRGTVSDELGQLFGASVTVENKYGRTIGGTATDMEGKYTLFMPAGESELTISFSSAGYHTLRFAYTGQAVIDAKLEQTDTTLSSEIVATRQDNNIGTPLRAIGYNAQLSSNYYYSDAFGQFRENVKAKVDKDEITPGDRAAIAEVPGSLRRNFHDDAFWKPALSTDKHGKASFEVTYPDDITKWQAAFIALDGKGKSHIKVKEIVATKPLIAELSLPRFALLGDSMNVIGKLTNYTDSVAEVTRAVTIDGRIIPEKKITVGSQHIDTIAVTVSRPDSVTLRYSLREENGYFDGEERSIPVFTPGIEETFGEFAVLNAAATRNFETAPSLGKATLTAHASAVDLFLDEIERTVSYPYMCNEQMASKLKALVAKKRIFDITGKDFEDHKAAKELCRRLEQNMNDEGLWGWWNRGKTELWITRQVIEALDAAVKAGITKTTLPKKTVHTLQAEMERITNSGTMLRERKSDFMTIVTILHTSFGRYPSAAPFRKYLAPDDINMLENLWGNVTTDDKAFTDTLLSRSKRTLTGSIYWMNEDDGQRPANRWTRPAGGSIEATLAAYRALRKAGGYDSQLEKIRDYFFEVRQGGFWRNTYESANILETILPDMLGEAGSFEDRELTVNGMKVREFPYKSTFDAGERITVGKNGTMPVFLTVHQQAMNEHPRKTDNGFSVTTWFSENGNKVSVLSAGQTSVLNIEVTAQNEANYVMIEVPIPAGCTYETKSGGYGPYEIHREHFREKVVIFCSKLPEGKHRFRVTLTPRFTGRYTLNPAKAELMYFPTLNGHEALKSMDIQ